MPRLRPHVRGIRYRRAHRRVPGLSGFEPDQAPFVSRYGGGLVGALGGAFRRMRRGRGRVRMPHARRRSQLGQRPLRRPASPSLRSRLLERRSALRLLSAGAPAFTRSSFPNAPATFLAGGSSLKPCRVLSCFLASDLTPALFEVCRFVLAMRPPEQSACHSHLPRATCYVHARG